MVQRLKMLFVSVASAVFAVASPLAVTATVSAQSTVGTDSISQSLCQGINGATDSNISDTDCKSDSGTTTINNIIKQVVNIFSLVVGVVAVIMIIVGGLKYITSGGDSSSVSSAKNTILYAIIGLVIVALAQFIVRFVFARLQAQTT